MKLFITTKNLDYIRNTQEIAILTDECGAAPDIIGSCASGYAKRMIKVITSLLITDFVKYDEIFIGFAPQLVILFFAGRLRRYKAKGGKLTIDFFISVYDTLVNDRKRIKEGGAAARFVMRLDKKTIDIADRVIVDTRAHGKYFINEFGLSSEKEEVLYLEANKTIYYPHEVLRDEKYRGKKLVLYFASALPLQGVDIVLKAAELMKDVEDVCFIIIGPVSERVLNGMAKPVQDNITYIDWLSQEELSDAIAGADICLAGHFNADIDKASRTIPGKAYIYRAMKKPMILGDNPANRELFDETQEGIRFCRMGDAFSLRDAITVMLEKDIH